MEENCNENQTCSCCSGGDYSELFSDKPSKKRDDQRLGIIYFLFLILATFNFYLGIVLFVVPIIWMLIKKEFSLKILASYIFIIIGLIINKI